MTTDQALHPTSLPASVVTAIVVNYRTLENTAHCVESWLGFYPELPLILVDNGSADDSTIYIQRMASSHSNIQNILNDFNNHHGPGMHQAIQTTRTPFVFLLDSDTIVHTGGFLEQMLSEFAHDPNLYALGRLAHKNRYGFSVQPGTRRYIRYIDPYAMLLDRRKYFQLRPFFHHGAPCIHNMQDAARSGFHVSDYPIQEFIWHAGRGTCSRYGYDLGPMTLIQGILTERIPTLIYRLKTRWRNSE
jgi:glycosyltransferase involved in cell wall biosynthesis